jgi:hypothetical protein
MSRRIAFWITSGDLLSNHLSAIQAREATINTAKPATVMRGGDICRHSRSEDGGAGRNGSQYRQFIHVLSKTKGCPSGTDSPCRLLTRYAAFRFTLLSAIVLSLLSVAFS